jgi:hypothetical protein
MMTSRPLRIVLEPGLHVDAVGPEIDVALDRQIPLQPARVLVHPDVSEPGDGRGREPTGVLAEQGCKRLLEAACGDALNSRIAISGPIAAPKRYVRPASLPSTTREIEGWPTAEARLAPPRVCRNSEPCTALNSGGLRFNDGRCAGRSDDAGGAQARFDEQGAVFRLGTQRSEEEAFCWGRHWRA